MPAVGQASGRAALNNLATIHGYSIAFWIAAGLFLAGAVLTGLLYERGVTLGDEEAAAEAETQTRPAGLRPLS